MKSRLPQASFPGFVFPQSVTLVSREDVPQISSVTVAGKEHNLGELRDFSWHPILSRSFLSQLSISWVRLNKGEELTTHRHPTPSIILVCKGTVLSQGECDATLNEGDMLFIPPGATHGFIGAGVEGFWGLSIQPRENGIYSDTTAAKVEFLPQGAPTWVDSLVADNAPLIEMFKANSLLSLFDSGALNTPETMTRFLGYFQIWSDCFQGLLNIRTSTNMRSPLHSLAQKHLDEERGHNTELRNVRRGDLSTYWDAELAGYCSWFENAVRHGTDVEQAVLMHLVIEASADIFYSRLAKVQSSEGLQSHVVHHIQHDANHYQMGVDALRETLAPSDDGVTRIQEQGWTMLGALFNRIAELLKS